MTAAGYDFVVISPSEGAEVGEPDGDPTSVYVSRLAVQKAADVAARVDQPSLIIACDTVADCDGVVLGKPRDREHARQMLEMLSGRQHSVWSGLCVWESATGQFDVQSECSLLTMQPLCSGMVEEYLDSGAWEGKSGPSVIKMACPG